MRSTLASLCCAFLTASSSLAQAQDWTPKRPKLPAGADTASAIAYYDYGTAQIERDPRRAADAFYWASRIAPDWAAPLYARRVAFLLANPRRLLDYAEGRRRDAETHRIDSLEIRARQRDPFLHRFLDRLLLKTYLTEVAMRSLRRQYGGNVEALRPEVEFWIQGYMREEASAEERAAQAYADNRFSDALTEYARALKDADDKAHIHAQRGHIFFLTQQYDSAQAALGLAIDERRKEDERDLVFIYESKAMLEFSRGSALESAGRFTEAQDAYAQAIVEDMAFYPAHVRLGTLAFGVGDTASAIAEMQLAASIAPDEAGPHVLLGTVLYLSGQSAEAVAPLERAIEIEPLYAEPYLTLGVVFEQVGNAARALECYRQFLATARQDEERRPWAAERLAALGQP